MTRITVIIATALSLAFTSVAAQDFQKGYAAYQAGDYATAIQEWTPSELKARECVSAQCNASAAHATINGQGVLQDYAEAVSGTD